MFFVLTEISAVVSFNTAMALPPFSGEAGDHQFSYFDVGLVAKVLEERHVVRRTMVSRTGFFMKAFMLHSIVRG